MIKMQLVLYFAGAIMLLIASMFLLCGCGAASVEAAPEEDAGTDVDAGGDSDSDSDADSDTVSATDSGPDVCADSCGNGTCDCAEDSIGCPLDCPATWAGCIEPHGARTCDEFCDVRGMLCVETCESEIDGNLHGMESCVTPDGPPYRAGGCDEPLAEGELIDCCCGRTGSGS